MSNSEQSPPCPSRYTREEMSEPAANVFCSGCGAPLAPWFDVRRTLYDVAADDEAFERWLDTPCGSCGRTPRELNAG